MDPSQSNSSGWVEAEDCSDELLFALRLSQDDPERLRRVALRFWNGLVPLDGGHYERRLSRLREILDAAKDATNAAPVCLLLALVLERGGEYEAAASYCRKGISLSESDPELAFILEGSRDRVAHRERSAEPRPWIAGIFDGPTPAA